MSWDYSELSKAAKVAGGPEAFVNKIEEESRKLGRAEGRSDMVPVIWLALAAGYGITKLIGYFKKKRAESQHALEEAKEELVNGIKEYDVLHSDDDVSGEEESVMDSAPDPQSNADD